MAKFKNLSTKTGEFTFSDKKYGFNDEFETSDKELIDYLTDHKFWLRIDKKSSSEKKEAPVEEFPAEEAPVEEAPVEEFPAEESPVEEAPVETFKRKSK